MGKGEGGWDNREGREIKETVGGWGQGIEKDEGRPKGYIYKEISSIFADQ
jgi:hypothetical protein